LEKTLNKAFSLFVKCLEQKITFFAINLEQNIKEIDNDLIKKLANREVILNKLIKTLIDN